MSTSGVFSTMGDAMSTSGGCSVHWGDTMRTSVGYHDHIGGCSVHRGNHHACGGAR